MRGKAGNGGSAHRLVSRGELGLEEIAGRVGFATARTLSRAFRRKFGITLSALRRG